MAADESYDVARGARSQGHDVILWIVAAGIFLGGAGLTALSLLLPSGQSVALARVLSAAGGVLLTSLGGVLAAYLVTRVAAVRDVEASYIRFLSGAARNLATVYNGLQEATIQRRNGGFAHEETYQTAVLINSNNVLAEYDSITSLSGRIRGAFKESKSDLDEVRSVFSAELLTTTRAAQLAGTPLTTPDPVFVQCPVCQSRVEGSLPLRAGWTARTNCKHCGTEFLIHRRSDMTIYVGRTTATTQSTTPDANLGVGVSSSVSTYPQVAEAAGRRPNDPASGFEVLCPRCNSAIRIAARSTSSDRTTRRICTECATTLTISVTERRVLKSESGQFRHAPIVDRRTSYAVVECEVDSYRLAATYPRQASHSWVALCTSHQRAYEVTRAAMREWLEEHDPAYLAARLEHEQAGGSRVISD